MSSFIFDWQLRQVIETNFNKFIFNNLTVPDVSDEIYEEISKISLTLSFKNKFCNLGLMTINNLFIKIN